MITLSVDVLNALYQVAIFLYFNDVTLVNDYGATSYPSLRCEDVTIENLFYHVWLEVVLNY